MDHRYSEFAPSSKKDWINNIQKGLKNRSYQDLSWNISERIAIEPVYTKEDLQNPNCSPILRGRKGWEIGQIIRTAKPGIANGHIHESLLGGVQAVRIHLSQPLETKDFELMFDDIHLGMISTHLVLLPEDKKSLTSFLAFIKNHYSSPAELIGTISGLTELSINYPDNRDLSVQVERLQDSLQGFKMINISEPVSDQGGTSVEKRLAGMIRHANVYLESLTEAGMDLNPAVKCIFFTLHMGESYYENLAKIRALRLLWQNLLDAYGAEKVPALCHVGLENSTKTGIDYGRLIAHTSFAMSAALGGADRIFLPVIDGNDQPGGTTFSRRMARNIQHVMQLEAHLDKVEDPLAGSYFIEYLTDSMGKMAWKEFIESPGLTTGEKRRK